MKRLIEFTLKDGSSILVEMQDAEGGGLVRASRFSDEIEKARLSFEEALENIRPAAGAIIEKIKTLSDPPDEVEVAFGLKLSAETGIVIAAGSLETNYTVTLKWTQDKKTPTTTPSRRKQYSSR